MKAPSDLDISMMRRCIELSRQSALNGEHPFAALICRDSEVIAESINRTAADHDVAHHAEQVVLAQSQKLLNAGQLEQCTLYSNVEPCVSCAFPIREARIGRVVFAISSPLMGGCSRWPVLTDQNLSRLLPSYFANPPEILSGVLSSEAEIIWADWNPELWRELKEKKVF
jgi:tRNA(adenine34) deaminase